MRVSSPLTISTNPEAPAVDFARLIPGEMPSRVGPRKPPRSVGLESECAAKNVATISPSFSTAPAKTVLSLAPGPLQSRMAWQWVTATVADFLLIGLNWLLLGALLIPLRELFPLIRLSAYGAVPVSLIGIGVLHGALITLMGYTEGLYVVGTDIRVQARILSKAVLWATTLLCVAYELQGLSWIAGTLFIASGLLHFVALWGWRCLSVSWRRSGQDRNARNALIIGAGAIGRSVAAYLELHPECGRGVYGFLDNECAIGNRVVGGVQDLARLARTGFVDEVILTEPYDRNLALQVLSEARHLHLDVEIVPELFGCRPSVSDMDRLGGLPVIRLHEERLPAFGLALKRVFDFAGAGAVLLALSPLMLLIAVLIMLESPGGAFYRAQRAGRKGRLFRCFKFRTMVSNAHALRNDLKKINLRTGPAFKVLRDPRVTRLGRFLRRYSLDELPQLWNVVKGEMSLVGPRPHPADEYAAYELKHFARLDVTPGMTGLWQVSARRDPSFERLMELDREYIRTWNLGLDLRILVKTVQAVIQGSGD